MLLHRQCFCFCIKSFLNGFFAGSSLTIVKDMSEVKVKCLNTLYTHSAHTHRLSMRNTHVQHHAERVASMCVNFQMSCHVDKYRTSGKTPNTHPAVKMSCFIRLRISHGY